MITLILDTANKYVAVGLYDNEKCLEAIQEISNRKQSETTIIYISDILKRHNLELLDVDQMFITKGPGSYTGVRVAMTIAKTLAAVSNIKIKTVSSLQALAGTNDAISILDARSKKIFIGVYSDGNSIVEDTIINVEEVANYIKQYPDFMVVGDCSIVELPEKDVDLVKNIFTVANMNDYVDDIDLLVPEYIKDVEAKKIC